MSLFIYVLLFLISALPALIVSLIAIPKRNSFTDLYNEGIKNENAGHYQLALHNYEGALREMVKFRPARKLTKRINQRIRILRTTIEYEQNFNPLSKL
jgi:hypothetical protein